MPARCPSCRTSSRTRPPGILSSPPSRPLRLQVVRCVLVEGLLRRRHQGRRSGGAQDALDAARIQAWSLTGGTIDSVGDPDPLRYFQWALTQSRKLTGHARRFYPSPGGVPGFGGGDDHRHVVQVLPRGRGPPRSTPWATSSRNGPWSSPRPAPSCPASRPPSCSAPPDPNGPSSPWVTALGGQYLDYSLPPDGFETRFNVFSKWGANVSGFSPRDLVPGPQSGAFATCVDRAEPCYRTAASTAATRIP